jgi:hypothetical protein
VLVSHYRDQVGGWISRPMVGTKPRVVGQGNGWTGRGERCGARDVETATPIAI